MKIAAHILIKNEARFVWYAVASVINHVDRILLWDTGSTDGTIEICKELKKTYGEKIDFKSLGEVDINSFSQVRQKMLDETGEDWFLMVDGDEVWWDENIEKLIKFIKEEGINWESIVVPTINLIGDIFHYQEEQAGLYKLAGRKGNLALRAVNTNIPGLHSEKPHGTWGWADEKGRQVQDREQRKMKFLDLPYLHATFLERAGERSADFKVPKRAKKLKHELGEKFPLDFYYPEVFFKDRPSVVSCVWKKMDTKFYLRSLAETPLRKVKRRLWKAKVGY